MRRNKKHAPYKRRYRRGTRTSIRLLLLAPPRLKYKKIKTKIVRRREFFLGVSSDDDYQVWNNSIIVARQSLLDLPPELWHTHTHTHTRHQREISRPDDKYLTTKVVGRDSIFLLFLHLFIPPFRLLLIGLTERKRDRPSGCGGFKGLQTSQSAIRNPPLPTNQPSPK